MVPRFKPLQWVIFEIDESKYLGKIIGAQYGKFNAVTEWQYTVNYGQEKPHIVAENEIIYLFENNEYAKI
jgi:hypothetical protein